MINKVLHGCVASLLLGWGALAHADIDVAPTRINMHVDDRTERVIAINRSQSERTLRILVLDTEEHAEGGQELLPEPGDGDHHLARHVRYSPRQVTLGPGERQNVRLRVNRPGGIDDQEMRGRIAVQTLPDSDASIDVDNDDGIAIAVQMLRAVTIPIAVEVGEPEVAGELRRARADGDDVVIHVGREGGGSLYGAMRVYDGDDASGAPIAEVNRAVAVVPLDEREFRLRGLLDDNPGLESVRVVYTDLDGDDVLFEGTLDID